MLMDTKKLEKLVKRSLDSFYARRLDGLESLPLKKILRRKNPYLFRATGLQKASEVIESLLAAYMSASDEGIFGDAFFEPIAQMASGGTVSPSEGVDVAIETRKRYLAVAVKSGPNIFNASQKKRQHEEFVALRNRLMKLHKPFDALLGHGYGRKRSQPTKTKIYRERSGQEFWEELTGDLDFYLKLVRVMKNHPAKHRPVYQRAWSNAVNRFTREFLQDFCRPSGEIEWEKLVAFNSGKRSEERRESSRHRGR